jgi:hypothetical protein
MNFYKYLSSLHHTKIIKTQIQIGAKPIKNYVKNIALGLIYYWTNNLTFSKSVAVFRGVKRYTFTKYHVRLTILKPVYLATTMM